MREKKERRELRERIKANIARRHGCWIWKGSISGGGYGTMVVRGKRQVVRRVSYQVFKRDDLGDHLVRSVCRKQLCVNPKHLVKDVNYHA